MSTPFFLLRPLGVARLAGATRLDLIERMSTQKVKQLQAGQGTATILTTDIGRMIDRLLLYAEAEEVLVFTGPGNAPNIIRYLMRYVFFQDDFRIRDVTAEHAILALYGAGAAETLRHMGEETAADLPLHHWQPATIAGQSLTLHRTDPVGGAGYFLCVPPSGVAAVQTALTEAGASAIDPATFERERIAAGLPLFGREITTDYIPLEANLWADVSFNKGCYIGQEIIARMDSRGQIAKQLVRLQAAVPLDEYVGSDLATDDGRPAGRLTSAAGPIALGYVKTAALNGAVKVNNEQLAIIK